MLKFLGGIIVGLLGVIVAFLIWGGRPKKYRGLNYKQLPILLRNLAKCLHHRGRIYIAHKDVKGWIWIEKHERKINPTTLVFRYRNADQTKPYFNIVEKAFNEAGVNVELELTPVRRSPRSLQVELDANQAASFSGMSNLARLAFEAIGAKNDGRIIVYAENPATPMHTRLGMVEHPNKYSKN